jgi:hypothetical protein
VDNPYSRGDSGLVPAGPDPAFLVSHPLFRSVRCCLRVAWISCAIGVIAMLPALVFLSPACVTVFRVGLGGCFLASFAAVVLSVPLVARMNHDAHPTPATIGARADALVAALVADLLDDA